MPARCRGAAEQRLTAFLLVEMKTLRTSEKRPEWGILQARNTGTNQRGELVFSLLATAFVPRRNGDSSTS